MLTTRLKILPADKSFKKIITKDDDRIDFSKLNDLIKEGRVEIDSWIGVRGSHGVAQVRSTTTGKLSSLFVENIPNWFKRKHNIGDANPDLINMYRQKFEEAIESGDKEEMKRWFREIMNNVSFTDAEPQTIGKHNDTPDDQFDADELAKGIQIEMEHTDDEALAKSIAKDHLAEIPDYYTRLLKMEAEAKQ